ncbi:MAG: rRNA adenine dimethyltransferase family protein, partial [Elusimicrobiota bacterium]|nr:rRNA adenine dimethyltransferase family protein [Elusimicrobiota bacterium]
LTYKLVNIAEHLICVEKDPELVRYVKEKFGGEKLRVITGDILKESVFFDGAPFNIISNLPYGISTDIIYFLAGLSGWDNCVLTLQKETVERFSAVEGSSAYGRSSVTASVFFDTRMAFGFSRKCFSPPPKVDAGVLVLKNKKLGIDTGEWKNFMNGCFFSRRKTLANNLKRFPAAGKAGAPDLKGRRGATPAAFLESLSINPLVRPQDVSPGQYLKLFKKI